MRVNVHALPALAAVSVAVSLAAAARLSGEDLPAVDPAPVEQSPVESAPVIDAPAAEAAAAPAPAAEAVPVAAEAAPAEAEAAPVAAEAAPAVEPEPVPAVESAPVVDSPSADPQGPVTIEERIAPTTEYARAKAELDQMLADRDLGLYEVDFQPLKLKRLVLKDRLGRFHAWNYLTFRVRNQAGGDRPVSQAEGYNAVLASIVAQYEGASVEKGNGVALKLDGVEGREGTVLERSDAAPANRKLALTAVASDERGTRLTTLDQLTGVQAAETFNFPDLGDPSIATADTWLRDKVEEVEGLRLLTSDEIRTRTLPPYDAAKPGEEPGWAAGEVFGVFVFPQLSDLGTRWRIEIRGVSNQFREKFPEGALGPDGKPAQDWLAAKVQRRVFVLDYSIPGDEYRRDEDRFTLVKAGWQWVPSFQRYERLRDRAWSERALDTIANPDAEKTDPEAEKAFWALYEQDRAARAGSARRLPDLQAEFKSEPGH